MTLDTVVGSGRPGQDELALGVPIIDSAPDVVPHPGSPLPFVDQSRRGAVQKKRRVQGREFSPCLDVQANFAASLPPGSLGLAAALDALNEDRTHNGQILGEQAIGDAGQILHTMHHTRS